MTSLLDKLRLEVLATTSGNEIVNHSAQGGTTAGWALDLTFGGETLTAQTGLTFGYGGKAVRAKASTVPFGAGFYIGPTVLMPEFPIVGGEFANVAVTVRGADGRTRDCELRIFWYDIGGNQIGTPAIYETHGGAIPADTDTIITLDNPDGGTSLEAPSGTVKARARISIQDNASNSMISGQLTYLFELMVVVGSTKSSVTGPVFSDVPETWQNVLPKALTARVLRGGDVDGVTDKLDAGIMVATVKDPLLTPENNDRIRPGRPVQLMALNGATWEPVFKGKLSYATTSYARDVPVVTLTATDAMADLDNYQQPLGKSGRFEQRVNSAMLDVPITYDVTDTDSNTTQVTISADESGTPLSQLTLVRDSLRGLFYVARDNILRCFANNSYPSQTPTVEFSDDATDIAGGAVGYVAIDTNFDSKNMVNTLTVTKNALSEADGSKVYGPYVNQDSVDDWYSVSADLQVNDGTPSTLAAAYLAVYDEPTIFCDSLTFNATNDVATAIERELYEAAQVKFAKASMDTAYRIISLEHIITSGTKSDKWMVTVKFKPMESTSTITVTNPAAGANTGPKELLPFTRETQNGSLTPVIAIGQSVKDTTIVFSKPYEQPPLPTLGLQTVSSALYGASCIAIDETSITIRVYRPTGASTATAAGVPVTWEVKPATT